LSNKCHNDKRGDAGEHSHSVERPKYVNKHDVEPFGFLTRKRRIRFKKMSAKAGEMEINAAPVEGWALLGFIWKWLGRACLGECDRAVPRKG
jgi:hypothetical protein